MHINAWKVRVGKTAKDHANGSKERNQTNKLARVSWEQDDKRTNKTFPFATCNGKKNRFRVTGKGGKPVFL